MKKYKEILILLIVEILVYRFIGNEEFFLTVKYFTTNRIFYIMISILFNCLYLYYFIEQYYTYILNRNHVIIRCGIKQYYKLIMRKILSTTLIFLISNILFDYILIKRISFYFLILNTLYFLILITLLPKRKEYSFELSITLLITMLLKYEYYVFLLKNTL